MPSSIATRTGDGGATSLLYGQRVSKSHPQIEAVGAVDELNAALGLAKAELNELPSGRDVARDLETTQRELVALMGEIACAEADAARYADSSFAKITPAELARLDAAVAELESRGLKFDGWATPGRTRASAALDVARTVARRAERRVVGLSEQGRTPRPVSLHYLNRLSDWLWLAARAAEQTG